MIKPIFTSIIVDDEATARYGLRSYINKIPCLECIGEFRDTMSLETFLTTNPAPDIMFMDIRMPERSGLDFIASQSPDSAVIVVTAYEEYALKGFDLNVSDYLLKPVSYERFKKAVDKTIAFLSWMKEPVDDSMIFLKSDRKIHKVFINDIEYLEAAENYVNVVTKSKRILTRATLKELLTSLKDKGIVQIHKSYGVNIHRIRSMENDMVVSDGNHTLPVSKTYKKELLKIIAEIR